MNQTVFYEIGMDGLNIRREPQTFTTAGSLTRVNDPKNENDNNERGF